MPRSVSSPAIAGLEFLTGFTRLFNQHLHKLLIPENWFSLLQKSGHSFLKIFGLVNLAIDLRILRQCFSQGELRGMEHGSFC